MRLQQNLPGGAGHPFLDFMGFLGDCDFYLGLRVPSRALVLNKKEHLFRCSFFVQAGLKRALHPRKTSFWRVPKTVNRTVFHLALVKTDNRCFGTHIISLCGFLKRSTGPFHISRLLKLRLFYSPNLRLLASTA